MTILDSIYEFKKLIPTFETGRSLYLTSGGFDPLHVGHLRCIQETVLAAGCRWTHPTTRQGLVMVIVNSDEFLMKKKGYVFMPLAERMELIDGLKGVDYVVPWTPIGDDMTVCEPIRELRPAYFTKGGDRKDISTIPEWSVCQEVGCKVITTVGGAKIQHSSQLVKQAYHSISNAKKHICIFDFDRTLCHCQGMVRITDLEDGSIDEMAPTEYARFRESGAVEREPARYEFDFDDFIGYPKQGVPILSTFRKLQKALETTGVTVAIVTGRGETKGPKEWLRDHGINVDTMLFFASNGPDKRPCFDSLFNSYTFESAHIFEDAKCYIEQCGEVCQKHGVKMTSTLVPERL